MVRGRWSGLQETLTLETGGRTTDMDLGFTSTVVATDTRGNTGATKRYLPKNL